MEVGKQAADPLKLIGRINKSRRRPLMGIEGRGGLKNPCGSRADGNDFIRLVGFLNESRGDFVCLGVHGVVPVVWGFDGAKRAQTHVKSDKGMGKLSQEFWREVKSGGGGGDGSEILGVGGLVIREIGWLEIRLAMGFAGFQDVGRERGKSVLV